MLKQYALAVCIGCALVGCASDELDPMVTGAPGFAGSASMGDGVAGARAAAGSMATEEPKAGGAAASITEPQAGSGAAGTGAAVPSAGSVALAAGAGGSTVVAAGSGGSAAGTTGAAGAVAGAPAMPCPDADADGVCDADDKCPAGSDVDADSNGYADACEKKLWEIKQSVFQQFSYNADMIATIATIPVFLTTSGVGCKTTRLRNGLEPDGRGVWPSSGVTVNATVPTTADFGSCSDFTPSLDMIGQTPVTGATSRQSPTHVAYVRLTGTGKLVDHRPSSGAYYYTVTVDVTWTAYGY